MNFNFNKINHKGCISLPYAQQICIDMGLLPEIPKEILFTYKNKEEFNDHFKDGEYYPYEDKDTVVELHTLTNYLCEVLGIEAPGKRFAQKDFIAKANAQAIKKHYIALGLLEEED